MNWRTELHNKGYTDIQIDNFIQVCDLIEQVSLDTVDIQEALESTNFHCLEALALALSDYNNIRLDGG